MTRTLIILESSCWRLESEIINKKEAEPRQHLFSCSVTPWLVGNVRGGSESFTPSALRPEARERLGQTHGQ